MTRARARRAFSHGTTRGHHNMDFFCLTPNGIRVAYPSRGVLSRLSPKARKRVRVGVLKVRHGQIQEIGIADRSLTGSRAAARRLLTSLD